MSYLNRLRQRASFAIEPYEEEQPVESAAPAEVAEVDSGLPDIGDSSFVSTAPATAERATYTLPKLPEVDNFDPFEVFGKAKKQAELATEIAAETGKEALKARRLLNEREFSDKEGLISQVAGVAAQILPGTTAAMRLAEVVDPLDAVTPPKKTSDSDITAYFVDTAEVPEELFQTLSASVIDENTPQAKVLKAQGRRAKKVRDADDIRMDVISRLVEKEYIKQYGDDGKRRYQEEVIQNIIDKASTPDNILTQRDAERQLMGMVESRLSPPDQETGEESQYKGLQRRAINLVLATSDPGMTKPFFDSAIAQLLPRKINLDPEIDRAAFSGLGTMDPETLGRVASTGSALERAEFLEKLFNLPTEFEIEGEEPIQTTLIGSQALREAIAQESFKLADKNTRMSPKITDPYEPLKSAAVEDENEQNRIIYFAGRAGVPAPMAYAISKSESTGDPAAFAYNLHIGSATDARTPENRRRTPEQEATLRQNLVNAGYDVALTPRESDGKYPAENFYGADANKIFREALRVNPVSAVQGGAWGEYQVLGRDGGLIDLMLDIEGVDTEEQAATQAVLQFNKNPSVIGDEMFVRWFQRDDAQAVAAREAANKNDVKTLSGLYYGTSSDPEQVKTRTEWTNRTEGYLKDYVSQMFVPPGQATTTETPAKSAVVKGVELLKDREAVDELSEEEERQKLAVEEELGVNLIQASTGGGLIASMIPFAELSEYPIEGLPAKREAAKDYMNLISESSPLVQDMQDSFRAPVGESYHKFKRSVYRTRRQQAEQDGIEITGEVERELELEARKEAFMLMTSGQTANAAFPPFQVSLDYVLGKTDDVDFVDALAPRVEVLGRVGGQGVIYRSEGLGVASLNAIDVPQAYAIGVAKYFLAPELGLAKTEFQEKRQRLLDADVNMGMSSAAATTAGLEVEPAVSMSLGATIKEAQNAGIRGIAERQNFVELGIEYGGEAAAAYMQRAIDEGDAQGTIDYLRSIGLIPSQVTGQESAELMAVDAARAAGSIMGAAAGFVPAIMFLDVFSIVGATGSAARKAFDVFNAIPESERSLEPLIKFRSEIYASGVARKDANTNVVATLEILREKGENATPQDFANAEMAISRLREIDNKDADFRQRGRASMDIYIDGAAEQLVGGLAQSDEAISKSAKDALDPVLSEAVFQVLASHAEKAVKSDDMDRQLLGARLQKLLNKGLNQQISLTPKLSDQKLKSGADALRDADVVFDTADRVEALLLGMRLDNPAEDAADLRKAILDSRMNRVRPTLGDVDVEYLGKFQDKPTLDNGLDFFGPVSRSALEDSLEGVKIGDRRKQDLLDVRDALEAFNTKLKNAVKDGSILDPDVRAKLQAEFRSNRFTNRTQRLFNNSSDTARGRRYTHVVNETFREAAVVTNSSEPFEVLNRGLNAVLTYSDARGESLAAFARRLVDEDAMRASGISNVDDFLDPAGLRNYPLRLRAALFAGTKEGVLSLVGSIPFVGRFADARRSREAARSLHSRALLTQMTADGQTPFSIASVVQGEVLRRLAAEKATAIDSGQTARVAEIDGIVAQVVSPEWRRSVVDWMNRTHDAYRAGGSEADLEKFPLPIGITLGIESQTSLPVLPATRKFARNSFFRSFGFAPVDRADEGVSAAARRAGVSKISIEEERAVEYVLDRLFRYMSRADGMINQRAANQKVAEFIERYLVNVRSVDTLANFEAKLVELRSTVESTKDAISKSRYGKSYEELKQTGDVKARAEVVEDAIQSVLPIMSEYEALLIFSRTYDEIEAVIAAARRGEGPSGPPRVGDRVRVVAPDVQEVVRTADGFRRRTTRAFEPYEAEIVEVIEPGSRRYEAGYRYKVRQPGAEMALSLSKNIQVTRVAPDDFVATRLFQDAADAGADADEVAEARRLWEEQGIESPYFRRWFGESKVVDDEGQPLVVYHGTSRDFDQFARGDVEGAFGSSIYFSDDVADVNRNYARLEGPDIRNRVDREIDRIDSLFDVDEVDILDAASRLEQTPELRRLIDAEDVDGLIDAYEPDIIEQMARQAALGDQQFSVLPVYLKMENPVYLDPSGKKGRTVFELESIYDDAGDLVDETGSAIRLFEAIDEVASEFDAVDEVARFKESLLDDLADGEIDAITLMDRIRESDAFIYDPDTGDIANTEFMRTVFERMGFDSIIADAYYHFGPKRGFGGAARPGMEGVKPGTYHYMAFEPTQVKSVYNRGTFDPQDARVLFQRDDGQRVTRRRVRRLGRMLDPDMPVGSKEALEEAVKADKRQARAAKRTSDMAARVERKNTDFVVKLKSVGRDVERYANAVQRKVASRRVQRLEDAARQKIQEVFVDFVDGSPARSLPDLLIDLAAAIKTDEGFAEKLLTQPQLVEALQDAVRIAENPESVKPADISRLSDALAESDLSETFDVNRMFSYTGQAIDPKKSEAVADVDKAASAVVPSEPSAAPAVAPKTPVKMPEAPERAPEIEEALDDIEKLTGIENLKSQVETAALNLKGEYGRDAEVVLKAIDMIGAKRLDDISLVVGGEGPEGRRALFDFTDNVIRIYDDALEAGVFSDEVVKELWRSLTRYVPEDEVKALSDEWLNERAELMRRMPEKFDEQGNVIGAIDDKDLRLLNFDDWVVQTMKDEALRRARNEVFGTTAKGRRARDPLRVKGNKVLKVLIDVVSALVEEFLSRGKNLKQIIENLYSEEKYVTRLRNQDIQAIVTNEDLARRASEWSEFLGEVNRKAATPAPVKMPEVIVTRRRKAAPKKVEEPVVAEEVAEVEAPKVAVEPTPAAVTPEFSSDEVIAQLKATGRLPEGFPASDELLSAVDFVDEEFLASAPNVSYLKALIDSDLRVDTKRASAVTNLVEAASGKAAEQVQLTLTRFIEQAGQDMPEVKRSRVTALIGEKLSEEALKDDFSRVLRSAIVNRMEEIGASVDLAEAGELRKATDEELIQIFNDRRLRSEDFNSEFDTLPIQLASEKDGKKAAITMLKVIDTLSEGAAQGRSLREMFENSLSPFKEVGFARQVLERQMKSFKRGDNLTTFVGDDGELYVRLVGDKPLVDEDDVLLTMLRDIAKEEEQVKEADSDVVRPPKTKRLGETQKIYEEARTAQQEERELLPIDTVVMRQEVSVGTIDGRPAGQKDSAKMFETRPGLQMATNSLEDLERFLAQGFSRVREDRQKVLDLIADTALVLAPYVKIDLPEIESIDDVGKARLRSSDVKQLMKDMVATIRGALPEESETVVDSAIDQIRAQNLQEAVETKRAEAPAVEPTPLPKTAEEHTPLSSKVIEQSTLRTADGDSVSLPPPKTFEEVEAIDNIDEAFLDMKPSELSAIAVERGLDLDDFRRENGSLDVVALAKSLSKQDSDALRSQRLVTDAAVETKAAKPAVEEAAKVESPVASADVIQALDEIDDALSAAGVNVAKGRHVRLSKLVREAGDLRTLSRQDIADRVFADLDFAARRQLASDGTIDDLVESITETVDTRIKEVAKEVVSLRKKAAAALKKVQTSSRDATKKNYQDAAARYQRQADTMQSFLDDVLRKEKVDLADEMGAALGEQAARRAAAEAAAPAPESVRAPAADAAFAQDAAKADKDTVTYRFTTAKGSTYEFFGDQTTIRDKSYHPEHGPEDVGIKPRSVRTMFIAAKDIPRIISGNVTFPKGVSVSVVPINPDASNNFKYIGTKYETGPNAGKFIPDSIVEVSFTPRVGATPFEIFDDGKTHFGNPIIAVEGATSQPAAARAPAADAAAPAAAPPTPPSRRDRPPKTPSGPPTPKNQGISAPDARAMVYFMDDSSAIIYALKNADASSGLHEMAHILRRHLREEDLRVTLDWVNSQLTKTEVDGKPVRALAPVRLDKYGNFTGNAESVVTAEELFAEAHEIFLLEGRAPNKPMKNVFKIMKELLRNIITTLGIVPHELEISREMYAVFDRIYGATTELDYNQLIKLDQYFDSQAVLSGEDALTADGALPTQRLAGRLESDLMIEDELTDQFRQRLLSLQEYSSRMSLFKKISYQKEKDAFGLEKLGRVGARGIGLRGAEDYGPITRRFLSPERGARLIGGKETEADKAIQLALGVLDVTAVTAADAAVFLPYTLLYGSDAKMLLRSSPTNVRTAMYGYSRELEEFNSGLSVLVNDVSRRTGSARDRGIDDIINYLQGNPTYLLTGAEKGTLVKGNGIKSVDSFFDSLDRYLARMGDEGDSGRAALLSQAREFMSKGSVENSRALSGFWRGYKVDIAGKSYGAEHGLLLDGAYEDLVIDQATRGDTITLDATTQDALDLIFESIQGEAISSAKGVGAEAQKVAALLLFSSGKFAFEQNGVTVTLDLANQLSGESTRLGLLMRGATFELEGQTIKIPGLFDVAETPGDALRAMLSMGVSGAMTQLGSDAARMGMGINAGQYRSYLRYVTGQRATMTPSQIDEAKFVSERFGMSMGFERVNSDIGTFYVPKPTMDKLRSTQNQAKRLLGLTRQSDSGKDVMLRGLSWLHQLIMQEAIFGSLLAKPPFRLAQTMDASIGAATVAPVSAAAATAARMGAGSILGFGFPGAELLSAERMADIGDVALKPLRQARDKFLSEASTKGDDAAVAGLKERLRKGAIREGDKIGQAISEFASNARNRVESAPIMNNDDRVVFLINGRLYRASTLRKIFIQNGLYSNPYKGVQKLLASERGVFRLTGRQDKMAELSSQNRTAVESATELLSSSARDGVATLRGVSSTLFEHGLESMDALADFERTGMAVSFMEQGASPQLAAKLVAKAVYDYRGSLTSADRTFIKKAFVPFFGFQKNAVAHVTDMLASPRGRFFLRAAARLPRLTTEAATTLFFETVVGPYGVNSSGMSEAELNLFYKMRAHFELGLGDDVSAEDLLIYRELLPDEAKDISDEELMDYSFNGWTVRDGYNGYDNVPEDIRIAFRYLLLARGKIRAHGRYVKMSDMVANDALRNRFAQLGAALAVQEEPNLSGFPSWAAARYPTMLASAPVLTNSVEQQMLMGIQNSIGFMLPDNFVNAGIEQAAALFSSLYAGAVLAGSVADTGTGSAQTNVVLQQFLNASSPIFDVRGGGSPTAKILLKSAQAISSDEDLYVELDPFIARILDGSLVAVQRTDGDEEVDFLANLTPRQQRVITTAIAAAATMDPSVLIPREVTFPEFAETARTGVVMEEGGKRVVKYLDKDYEYVHDIYEARRKRPFLQGRDAILFKQSRFGRVNDAMLRLRTTPQEDALRAEENLQNEIFAMIVEQARKAGVRVMGSDVKRTMQMDKPDLSFLE